MQPLPPSISRTLCYQTETPHPLNNNSPFLLFHHKPLATTILLSLSVSLTTLGTSYKWNYYSICSLLTGISLNTMSFWACLQSCFLYPLCFVLVFSMSLECSLPRSPVITYLLNTLEICLFYISVAFTCKWKILILSPLSFPRYSSLLIFLLHF